MGISSRTKGTIGLGALFTACFDLSAHCYGQGILQDSGGSSDLTSGKDNSRGPVFIENPEKRCLPSLVKIHAGRPPRGAGKGKIHVIMQTRRIGERIGIQVQQVDNIFKQLCQVFIGQVAMGEVLIGRQQLQLGLPVIKNPITVSPKQFHQPPIHSPIITQSGRKNSA